MHIVNRSPWSPNSLKTNMLINREVMQKKKIIIISLSWVVLYRLTTKLPPMRCVLFSIRTEESHDDKAEDTCSFGPNTEKKSFLLFNRLICDDNEMPFLNFSLQARF